MADTDAEKVTAVAAVEAPAAAAAAAAAATSGEVLAATAHDVATPTVLAAIPVAAVKKEKQKQELREEEVPEEGTVELETPRERAMAARAVPSTASTDSDSGGAAGANDDKGEGGDSRKKNASEHIDNVYKALADMKVDPYGAVEGTFVWGGVVKKGLAPKRPAQALRRGADGLTRPAAMDEYVSLLAEQNLHFDAAQIAGPLPVRVSGTGAEAQHSFVLLNKLYGTKIVYGGRDDYIALSIFAPIPQAIPPGAWMPRSMRFANGQEEDVLVDAATVLYLTGYHIADQPLTRLHESGIPLFGVALSFVEVDERKPGRTAEQVALETARSIAEQRRGPNIAVGMYERLHAIYQRSVAARDPARSMLVDYERILAAIKAGNPDLTHSKDTGKLRLPSHANGTAEPFTDASVRASMIAAGVKEHTVEDTRAKSAVYVLQELDAKAPPPEPEPAPPPPACADAPLPAT